MKMATHQTFSGQLQYMTQHIKSILVKHIYCTLSLGKLIAIGKQASGQVLVFIIRTQIH